MALADLALQMSVWDTVVPDLIQRFVGNDNKCVKLKLKIEVYIQILL